MNPTKRGFLKLASALIGGVSFMRYAEPVIAMPKVTHDWIDDRGDFVIITVPDFKTFKNEVIPKPAIFALGEGALVAGCEISGFSNIFAKQGASLKDCLFDGSRMLTENSRAVVTLVRGFPYIVDSTIIGNTQSIGLCIEDSLGGLSIQRGNFPALYPANLPRREWT